MPLSVMSALMLLAAHASGFICDPARCRRAYGIYASLFLAALLILKRFDIAFSPELIINAASAAFVLIAIVSYALRAESGAHTLIIIALSAAFSLIFHPLSYGLSRDAGLLACGLLTTGANIALKGKGRAMLLVCALSTLLFEAEKTLLMLITRGYAYFDLASDSLDRMMICALFTGFAHGIVNWSMSADKQYAVRV